MQSSDLRSLEPVDVAASKWNAYYSNSSIEGHLPPWDSGMPCTQLVKLVSSGEFFGLCNLESNKKKQLSFLDIGCGSGSTSCFMAIAGWRVTGIDICKRAIELSNERWRCQQKKQAIRPNFVCADFFNWVEDSGEKQATKFDLVFDCQFFHAVIKTVKRKSVATAISKCVAAGGKLVLLTGNCDESRNCGPTRLNPGEILNSFLGCLTYFLLFRSSVSS